ncbi:MAG: nucleoid-associated protein [Helicobacteraceae bacterium]|jgi:hypothetical protein|nr:nucleoid-associated protein [Helicobacteraceae bacterium]
MSITDIQIERLIAHEAPKACDSRTPVRSDSLITLDTEGRRLMSERLNEALALGSHCVDVTVSDNTVECSFNLIASMLNATGDDFIERSKTLADRLTSAQRQGSIKAGVAIFIQGECINDNEDPTRFITVIKAETDRGFRQNVTGDGITLDLIDNMLMSSSQRLLKIGFFVEETKRLIKEQHYPDDFSIKVYDHAMQKSVSGNAATYFCVSFLGCRPAENAKRKTKEFFEMTLEIVRSWTDMDSITKVNTRSNLTAYMRSNETIINPIEFARNYIPQSHQDRYIQECRDKNIAESITKDVSLIKARIKKTSIKFSSQVTIVAPPDIFSDSVHIDAVEQEWTMVRIRGIAE